MSADLSVDAAILGRRSIRAFRPDPVPRAVVEEILEISARAPSGTNMQPWKAHVVMGAARDALCAAVVAAADAAHAGTSAEMYEAEYRYYPAQWQEPYIGRRRKVGLDMYALLGIGKGEGAAMHAQHNRNFTFFDAPVGIFFTIDKHLQIGSWLDYGMLLQNVMLAARARGLDTCPQAAWPRFHRIIRTHLGFPESETVICGLALGFADEGAVVNSLVTDRVPLKEWTTFHGE
jgi:nitroreductase